MDKELDRILVREKLERTSVTKNISDQTLEQTGEVIEGLSPGEQETVLRMRERIKKGYDPNEILTEDFEFRKV